MIRKEAIQIVSKMIGDSPIISANGYISRDLFEVNDKPSNFYMIGSMGLASSIGLGVALKNPRKRVFVFDGDGNLLMNLGSIVTISKLGPKNLVHLIFDNASHESTGGQPTYSPYIHLERIAKDANYRAFHTNSKAGLKKILQNIRTITGPIFVLVKVQTSNHISKRVSYSPKLIRNRFMNSF